jgi:hypothetical protein
MTLVAVLLVVEQPVLLEEVGMKVLEHMVADSFPLAVAAEHMMAAATILVVPTTTTNSLNKNLIELEMCKWWCQYRPGRIRGSGLGGSWSGWRGGLGG